uniref:Uncharacterized protein n=1 Tax=viral metagenome TaxID=1070528 RepID=A0A6C0CHP1_9ZZZZ
MEADDLVMICFRVSAFGWEPVQMRWEVWKEIFDRYDEPVMTELNDDSGQSVEVDLLDSVQNAIVCHDVSSCQEWINSIDSTDFFQRVCLDPEQDAWKLNVELSIFVREDLLRRKADIISCNAVALGTTVLLATLVGRDVKVEFRNVGEDSTRFLWIDEEEHDLGKSYRTKLNRILDEIQPKILTESEVGFHPTLGDEEDKVDLGVFDSLTLEDEN